MNPLSCFPRCRPHSPAMLSTPWMASRRAPPTTSMCSCSRCTSLRTSSSTSSSTSGLFPSMTEISVSPKSCSLSSTVLHITQTTTSTITTIMDNISQSGIAWGVLSVTPVVMRVMDPWMMSCAKRNRALGRSSMERLMVRSITRSMARSSRGQRKRSRWKCTYKFLNALSVLDVHILINSFTLGRLFGAKPLSKPMLGYCQLDWQEQTSMKFKFEFYHFHSR